MSIMENHVTYLRHKLKKRILNDAKFMGFEEERKSLNDVIEKVIQFGESDSVLICGPSGSGKTKLLNVVLKKLQQKNYCFFVVKLNGLVHTDDNLALKQIIKTLNANESIIEESKSSSFSCNLSVVLENLLTDCSTLNKPVIFILEEFQLFCSHPKQTLLYNLMDASQSIKVPVCVIGVTTCLDVTQLLEKRVKSRFSYNQITLFPSNNVNDRMELFKNLLSANKKSIREECDAHYLECWEYEVSRLIQDPKVLEVLKRQFSTDENEQLFRNTMLMVLTKIEPQHPYLEALDIINTFNDAFKDQTVCALQSLSVLEFCMIIAMKHQTSLYDDQPFNFEMIARRVVTFTSQSCVVLQTSPIVLMKAFQKLNNIELISPVSVNSKEVLKEYDLFRFNVTNEQVLEAIKSFSDLSPVISDWATSIC